MDEGISERARRERIASELADLLYRQRAILRCDEAVARLIPESQRRGFRSVTAEDEACLRMVEAAIGLFGWRVAPKDVTTRVCDLLTSVVLDPVALPVERLGAYATLKQSQALDGQAVRKAMLHAKADVREALASFVDLHVAWARGAKSASGMSESLGADWIMGEEPRHGLFARAKDAAAAAMESFMGQAAKAADEGTLFDVLRQDHQKAKTLLREIEAAEGLRTLRDLCEQLKMDVIAHSEAEEQVVYAVFQRYRDLRPRLDGSWSEHEDLRAMVDALAAMPPDTAEFARCYLDLKNLFFLHVDGEEDELFDVMEKRLDPAELRRLTDEFLAAKAAVQEQLTPRGTPAGLGAFAQRPSPGSPPVSAP